MVYTTDLKSVAEWLESSSLSARTNFNGSVGEWFNPAVLKTADPERVREFESHRFRQDNYAKRKYNRN